MPEANPKGGRPRLYPSQSAFESLVGRVCVLEARPAGAAPPVSAPDDRTFVENAIVALIASGTFTGGDSDLAPISAVVTSLVITRDLVLNNLGVARESRLTQLRAEGYLSHFGIAPERAAS